MQTPKTYAEVQLLIDSKEPENYLVDYKRQFPSSEKKHDICADVASFANADGGCIIFGVTTDTNDMPNGAQPMAMEHVDKEIERVTSWIYQWVAPFVTFDFIKIPAPQGGCLVCLEIFPSKDKPVAAVKDGHCLFYLRGNGRNLIMTRDQILGLAVSTKRSSSRVSEIQKLLIDKVLSDARLVKGPTFIVGVISDQFETKKKVYDVRPNQDLFQLVSLSCERGRVEFGEERFGADFYSKEVKGYQEDELNKITDYVKVYESGLILGASVHTYGKQTTPGKTAVVMDYFEDGLVASWRRLRKNLIENQKVQGRHSAFIALVNFKNVYAYSEGRISRDYKQAKSMDDCVLWESEFKSDPFDDVALVEIYDKFWRHMGFPERFKAR